ncbi:MAG TPA: hypothetical protein VLB50_04940 [Ignavibacteriaceae bacterium]|nr:hypothetical protein [Ignavibacteriaceae bacterium]
MNSSLIKISFSVFLALILHSCATISTNEKDISNLSESYFICDSVVSTPVSYRLEWSPKPSDSVYVYISGDPCYNIRYKSGWIKDSVVNINIDSKKSSSLWVALSFGLTSDEEYSIQYIASIENIELQNEKLFLQKSPDENTTDLKIKIYLPLFRLDSFDALFGKKFICSDKPVRDITFLPKMVDPALAKHSYTIKDYFRISVVSKNSDVEFYDKYLKKNAGKMIETRVNNFSKYQLNLTSPFEQDIDDTVMITYSIDDFNSKYEMYVTKNCPSEEKKDIIIQIGDGSHLYPGDTVDVYVAYSDENGNIQHFSNNAIFEAGLLSGCNSAKIMNEKGELKNFFDEIKQPIRLVITFPYDSEDSQINLGVGYKKEEGD